MAIFKCLVTSNYGKKGELVDVKGLEHEKMSDRQKVVLTPYVEKAPKVVESKVDDKSTAKK